MILKISNMVNMVGFGNVVLLSKKMVNVLCIYRVVGNTTNLTNITTSFLDKKRKEERF